MRAYSSLPRHYTRPASLSAAAAAAAAADAAAASDSGVGTQEEAEDGPRPPEATTPAPTTPALSATGPQRDLGAQALSTDPSTDDVCGSGGGAGAESSRRVPARRRRNDVRRPPPEWGK